MKNMYSETYQVKVADLGNYEKEKQIEILTKTVTLTGLLRVRLSCV